MTAFCKSTTAGMFVTAVQEFVVARLVVDSKPKFFIVSGHDTKRFPPLAFACNDGKARLKN